MEKKDHKVEKHRYRLDKDGNVLIFPKDTPQFEQNPKIEGREAKFDATTKDLIFYLKEGEAKAVPFGSGYNQEKIVSSQYGFRLIELGRRLERMNNPNAPLKLGMDKMWLMLLVTIGLTAINVYFTFKVMDHLGIKLF